MKIGELQQHCGECQLIEYCAEPYSEICICTYEKLKNVDEELFKNIADVLYKVDKLRKKKTTLCFIEKFDELEKVSDKEC